VVVVYIDHIQFLKKKYGGTVVQTSSYITSILSLALLAGCENADERYDAGFNDGYAVGYNTTCEIRATLIESDWDSENYKAGYDDGYADGAAECRRDRANNR
jgi:hypothetical protein